MDRHAAAPGPGDLLHGLARGDVDDEDRCLHDLRQRDGAVGRLALGGRAVGDAEARRADVARPLHAVGEPADAVVVLAVDHDKGVVLLGRGQHVENLHVLQLQPLVGHVDLEAGVAVLDQGRQLLAQHLGRRVGQDQVEAVVQNRLALGPAVIPLDRLAQALALHLAGEGDDRRGAAAGRGDRGRFEVVGELGAAERRLADVAMTLDAARQDEATGCIDHVVGGRDGDVVGQGGDPAILHRDVGDEGVGSGRHPSVLDDEIVVRHGHAPVRFGQYGRGRRQRGGQR